MSPADLSSWIVRIAIGYLAIGVVIAIVGAAIERRAERRDPEARARSLARSREWQKEANQRHAVLAKGMGIGMSFISFPIGLMVVAATKLGQARRAKKAGILNPTRATWTETRAARTVQPRLRSKDPTRKGTACSACCGCFLNRKRGAHRDDQGENRARFSPWILFRAPLRSAMGSCLPSRPHSGVESQRHRAAMPMVGCSP